MALDKKSLCRRCVHLMYERGIHCCGAFPPYPPYNGIPEKYRTGEAQHLTEDKNQSLEDMVFLDKKPYPML